MSNSDINQQLWVWNLDNQRLYYDLQEKVRFRVVDEEWHDHTPTKPIEQGEQAEEDKYVPPYKIKGSMKDSGFGPCLWWD